MNTDASRRLTCLIPDLPVDPGRAFGSAPLKADNGHEARLCSLFGLETRPPPVAAIARLGEGGEADDGWWLRADPVCLTPRVDHLVLAPELPQVTQFEAEALAEEIGSFFASDNWRLEARRADQWYLRLPGEAAIETTPLHAAIGRDIAPLLPRGTDARQWRRYLTELQMLLSASPINSAREARGEVTINSVWLWGEGYLPATPPVRRWTRVWCEDSLARGLAKLTGTPHEDIPQNAESWLMSAEPGEHLLVMPGAKPGGRLKFGITQASLPDLEQAWLAPLRRAIRSGAVESVYIDAGNGPGYDLGARESRGWHKLRALVRGWLSG